jgi:hypothetical protein
MHAFDRTHGDDVTGKVGKVLTDLRRELTKP